MLLLLLLLLRAAPVYLGALRAGFHAWQPHHMTLVRRMSGNSVQCLSRCSQNSRSSSPSQLACSVGRTFFHTCFYESRHQGLCGVDLGGESCPSRLLSSPQQSTPQILASDSFTTQILPTQLYSRPSRCKIIFADLPLSMLSFACDGRKLSKRKRKKTFQAYCQAFLWSPDRLTFLPGKWKYSCPYNVGHRAKRLLGDARAHSYSRCGTGTERDHVHNNLVVF